jgi:protein-disulfide isomerase
MTKTLELATLTMVLSLACWTPAALAAPRHASEPTEEQRKLGDELLATQHPYECCSETIAACLQRSDPCPLALRLERAIRRMVLAGMSRREIEEALSTRKESMVASAPLARIGSDERFQAGNSAAPVVLSIYASSRSTQCAKLIPALYVEVCSGRLQGKVRLQYRPFFSATDPMDEASGRAMIAAADQGLFWPYLLHLYAEQERLQPSLVQKWAYTTGVDRGAFDLAFESAATASLLAEIRREALENGAVPVPTAFINGRRTHCGLSVDTLVDLLDEEYERVTAGASGRSARRDP